MNNKKNTWYDLQIDNDVEQENKKTEMWVTKNEVN